MVIPKQGVAPVEEQDPAKGSGERGPEYLAESYS